MTVGLGLLGLTSGALAARVAALQFLLIPVSVVSLGVAHYVAYRKRATSRWQRPALWAGTALALITWLSALLTT